MVLEFSDVSVEGADVVSFDSKENEQKYVRDCLIQTEPRVFASRSTQVIRRKEIPIQTEDTSHEFDPTLVPFNDPRLVRFLSHVEDTIFTALEENLTSDHFAGYDVDWSEDQDLEIKCVNTFFASESLVNTFLNNVVSNDVTGDDATSEQYQSGRDESDESRALALGNAVVSSVSWNCQGSLFAASLANTQHEHWCIHKSMIVLWNIGRTKIDPKKPHNSLECSGCITTTSFHPSNPALLAAASFNGEVFIYDLSREEASQLIVNVASLHTEPISTVCWVTDPESNALHPPYMLVTSGQDGKVLLSSLNELSKQLTLVSGQVLLSESITTKTRSATSDSVLGVSVLCTFVLDQTSFVLGSETGGVFKCSFNHSPYSRIVHSITQQDVQFSSAAQLSLESHLGPVTSIAACPFHWKIVLTASADSTLRIYNVLQAEPCLVITTSEPVSCVDWSPVRPMVFAAVTTNCNLLFFDLIANRSSPVHSIMINNKVRASSFASVVKFNVKSVLEVT
ncbi:cytoplasmic dynein 2 intermediate chain 2-like isoform X2 [Convolutriloba macropyga]|uniref:cytoplasmic dynein 2 intermediate chain 2-like isoform X2 n=1 Tax=Convolutriloba macropyga TaxID=536237 RepID=UPI003F51CB80